jgi:hypothetical protein
VPPSRRADVSLGPRTLVSGVIVLVLGLQVISMITWSGRYTWPFTDYPMYARSRHEGDRVVGRHFLYAVLEDGREVEVTPDDLGGNVFVFEKWIDALQLERTGLQVSSDVRRATNKRLTDNRQSWPLRNWLTSTYLFKAVKRKPDPDLALLFIDHIEKENGWKIRRLRIEDTGVIVTRSGASTAPPRKIEIELPLSGRT